MHETHNWRGGQRIGVGSGLLERVTRQVIDAEKAGTDPLDLELQVPMFKGLMANPLAREFVTDGPMLLIGAGVGFAPFRGFVQKRLRSATCANKVWVLHGVRDSVLDGLYSGEWGVEEEQVKKAVQSRRGQGRYVQVEVRQQADLGGSLSTHPTDGYLSVGVVKGWERGWRRRWWMSLWTMVI